MKNGKVMCVTLEFILLRDTELKLLLNSVTTFVYWRPIRETENHTKLNMPIGKQMLK